MGENFWLIFAHNRLDYSVKEIVMAIKKTMYLMGLMGLLFIFSCNGGNPEVNQYLDELEGVANQLVQAVENGDESQSGELMNRLYSLTGKWSRSKPRVSKSPLPRRSGWKNPAEGK
jgi:hypothetical protein